MKIKLIHWDEDKGRKYSDLLKALGHQVDVESIRNKEVFHRIKNTPPEIFIIDLSKLPSHGKEIAVGLRQIKSTRNVPFIFTEGEEEKTAGIKLLLPDAVYSSWKGIKSAINKAAKQKDSGKIIPPSMMERYSDSPLAKKLGIKEGDKIALVNPPPKIKEVIGELPPNVKFVKKLNEKVDVIIWFVRSREEFDVGYYNTTKFVDSNKIWIATIKQSSGMGTDINQNIVRNICLNEGLVDYKVCSIDEKWSGLLLTRRKQSSKFKVNDEK